MARNFSRPWPESWWLERVGAPVVARRFHGARSAGDLLGQRQRQAGGQLLFRARGRFRQTHDHAQRIGIVRDRFLHGEAAQIAVAGLPPVPDGLLAAPGALELLRDDLRGRSDRLGEALLQNLGDGAVQLLAAGAQHGWNRRCPAPARA